MGGVFKEIYTMIYNDLVYEGYFGYCTLAYDPEIE